MTNIHSCSYYCNRPECIKAQRDELRERLAQPEQEPVIGKWSLREVYFDEDGEPISHRSPPQRTWVGLTEEEHKQIQRENWPKDQPRAIEAKLKEKNT